MVANGSRDDSCHQVGPLTGYTAPLISVRNHLPRASNGEDKHLERPRPAGSISLNGGRTSGPARGGGGGVMGLAADNHFMILAQVSQTAVTRLPKKPPPFPAPGDNSALPKVKRRRWWRRRHSVGEKKYSLTQMRRRRHSKQFTALHKNVNVAGFKRGCLYLPPRFPTTASEMSLGKCD